MCIFWPPGPPRPDRPGGGPGEATRASQGVPQGHPLPGLQRGAIGGVLGGGPGRGCSYSRAPCGRPTTLILLPSQRCRAHSLSLVTVLHTDDDVAMVMHDDVSDDVMHVMDDAMMSVMV